MKSPLSGVSRRAAMPYVLVFLVAFACCGLHQMKYRQFSPIDELRHLDYAVKISHGHLTHFGEKVGETAMREEMCRKVDLAGWADPPCGKKKIDPVQFRDDGWQTASPHPPLYYIGAGVSARVLHKLGLTDSYVAGARLFSAFVTALGIMMIFHVTRRLGTSIPVGAGAALSILVFPSLLHSAGIVTPDSASLLVGATVAAVVLKFKDSAFAIRWLAVLGVVAGATKLTNLFAASAGALFLFLASGVIGHRSYRKLDAEHRRLIKGAFALLIGAAATTVLWLVIDSARATIDPAIIPQNVINKFTGWPSLDYLLLRDTALRWLPPADGYIQAKFSPEPVLLARWILEIMLAGGAFAALMRARTNDDAGNYVAITGITAVLGAPLFTLASTRFSETLVQAQGRYGLSLLPVLVVGMSLLATSAIGRRFLASFGFIAAGMMIICLINAPTLR